MGKKLAYLTGLLLGAYMALAPNVNAQTKPSYTVTVKVKNEFFDYINPKIISIYSFSGKIGADKIKAFYCEQYRDNHFLDVLIDPGDTVEIGFKEKRIPRGFFNKTKSMKINLDNIVSINGRKLDK